MAGTPIGRPESAGAAARRCSPRSPVNISMPLRIDPNISEGECSQPDAGGHPTPVGRNDERMLSEIDRKIREI